MKILVLDQFSDTGGAQRALLDTIEAIEQRGWQAWAAIPPGGPLVEQLRTRNISLTEIPCGPYLSGTKALSDVPRFLSDLQRQGGIIRDLLDRVPFDLIYVNGPRLLPAVALAAHGRAPVLFHAHSHVGQHLARSLAGWSIRRSNAAVVACSKSVLEPLRGFVALPKQHVIPNGVREIELRSRTFARGGACRIGLIGRISPEKGQAEFVRAAALLHTEFPDARFIICGAPLFAAPGYLDLVRGLARGLPVEFLGWRDDVAAVLAELDLLVVPSKSEGMGRVVVEAFSAGVPVLAFAVGGIPELITHLDTGFLAREASVDGLAASIREIIASEPDVLSKVAANARRSWERSYTVGAYQQRITELMERLVSEHQTEHETVLPQPRR